MKPFQRQGQSTAFDNAFVDHVMPALSGSAWKVLSFIIRRTIGHQKEWDKIAYSQIKQGCGISTNAAVRNALRELEGLTLTRNESNKAEWTRDYSKPDLILRHLPEGRDNAGHLQTAYYSLNIDVSIFP